MVKTKKIIVNNTEISVIMNNNENDYICLTDMMRAKDGNFFISDWLRNRNTLEYIDTWERLYNPLFNYGEFAIIKSKAGLNNFKVSVKELVEKTNLSCIVSKTGRYGGTYAHKDVAFNFCMWISPAFQLYVVKEYQRLRDIENNPLLAQWNTKRLLAKTNYMLHTDTIKSFIVPKVGLSKFRQQLAYATEADMLNIILFGCTAKTWEEANPQYVKKGMNVRDTASINQLVVLSNLESMNSELIKQGIARDKRMAILHKVAKSQLAVFDKMNIEQKFRQIGYDGVKQLD